MLKLILHYFEEQDFQEDTGMEINTVLMLLLTYLCITISGNKRRDNLLERKFNSDTMFSLLVTYCMTIFIIL